MSEILVRPISDCASNLETYFREFLESARKDIECLFGVFKSRWRFLKNALRYHSSEIITGAFHTAGIIHNMLLEFDGLDEEIGTPEDYSDENIEEFGPAPPSGCLIGEQVSLITFNDIFGPEGNNILTTIKGTRPALVVQSLEELNS